MSALDTLPAPDVIEKLDYETILAALVADAQARLAAAGIAWDVGALETDPVKILLETAAYRELLLRARINDAARANLLAFATDGDLDHLGAFHDVTRLAGEDDIALRERVRLTILGRSAGGPEERYKAVIMGVSARVRDAAIWRDGRDPTVRAAVLSSEIDGVADAVLLADVLAALEAPDIRVVSDRFKVVSAVQQSIDVTLNVRLAPDAPQSLLADIPTVIGAEWRAEKLLGLDLTLSWLTAKAMRAGVSRVEVVSPAADITVAPHEAIALGTVTVIDGGRGR